MKWMRLGIVHERIEPGKPTQKGRHERLHRTLKEDTASPPAQSLAEQREHFTAFQYCFIEDRPHQALLMQTLPRCTTRSSGISQMTLLRFGTTNVTSCAQCARLARFTGKAGKVFITEVLRRERIGLLPTRNGAFQVYFEHMYLGILESETATFNPNRQCPPQAQTHEQHPVSG